MYNMYAIVNYSKFSLGLLSPRNALRMGYIVTLLWFRPSMYPCAWCVRFDIISHIVILKQEIQVVLQLQVVCRYRLLVVKYTFIL